MSRRFNDLLLRQGRLIERLAGQRAALRRDFKPVARALGRIDSAVIGLRSGADYLNHHALAASAVVGFFLIFKGRTTLRWARRTFLLWQSWRVAQNAIFNPGGRVRS
ncbi:MAG: YqjK-like family protein [Candidatus Accumulibacter sp.]|jgi:hypothetical protein|nr:YqjK-like family protein [Accumulibacter sp.]